MDIVWTKRAASVWVSLCKACAEQFGLSTVNKQEKGLVEKLEFLSKNPEMGFPEPVLQTRRMTYRSIIFHKNYKLIYRVSNGNRIYIVDIWDMRRNPETLRNRI